MLFLKSILYYYIDNIEGIKIILWIVLNTEDSILTKFKYSISYTKTSKSKEYVDDLFLEIIEFMKKLQEILTIVENKKNTNSRLVSKTKEVKECPHCHSNDIVKNGHDKNNVQNYKCKNCKKRFNDLTNTVASHSKLTYEKLVILFECMNDKLTIEKTAAKTNVNKNTVFLLRHKVLDCISEIRTNIKLKGNVEADETYESINLKGTKRENMPRLSKPRSSNGGSKRGISNHQICIASAIDEFDNFFLEIIGTGPITSDAVKKVFNGKIDNSITLITDCKSSYEEIAHSNNLHLGQVKSKTYVNSNYYSLGNINSLHSEWPTFLSKFRGISTKHLQHYLDWFNFQKIINYTTDILKQPMTIMKKIIAKKCNLNSKNVYENSSKIDFEQVYADYNNLSLTILERAKKLKKFLV